MSTSASPRLKKTKDVVEVAQISRETLKFYERKGLVKASSRTEAGYRLYSEASIQRLMFIRAAQKVGFSLKEISELLSLGSKKRVDTSALKEIAKTKVQSLDAKITKLQSMRSLLESYILDPASWENDPECATLLAVISAPA